MKDWTAKKAKVAQRRARARALWPWFHDLEDYLRLFYRSQRTLARRGNHLKALWTRTFRSRERQALQALLKGEEGRYERLLPVRKARTDYWW